MDAIGNFIIEAANVLWGQPTIWLLLGSGILFTILLKVPQLKIGDSFRLLFRKQTHGDDKTGTSTWQSVFTVIGGQVGCGNIVGPATSIIAGGPGALFWCWMSAIFGQAIMFCEAVCAQQTKVKLADGTVNGGPGYYIRRAFPGKLGKALAGFFALLVLLGYGWGATLNNSNSMADALFSAYSVPKLVTGIIISVLVVLVVAGGLKRISNVMSYLVPIMAVIYVLGGLIILLANISEVPALFAGIFKAAFTSQAVLGGAAGVAVQKAMRYGFARGLLSNEAGMGSTPMMHATADVKNPCDQGIASMITIVFDTLIILTMSGLVILSTGAHLEGLSGVAVVQYGFTTFFGAGIGNILITVAIVCFCFTTIVTGYYYGKSALGILTGGKKWSVVALICLLPVGIILGSLIPLEVAWSFLDCCYALMVWINVISLWLNFKHVNREWTLYRQGGADLDTTLNDVKKAKLAKKAAG